MSQPSLSSNPFMLMIDPEVVIAAMEKSERLSGLNRHICRPLDRHLPLSGSTAEAGDATGEPVEADDASGEAAGGLLSD
jgi:hypothetical protein